MVRLGVGLTCLWTAVSVVVGAPVRLATRDVTSDVLQQLSLFEQYSAASYCTNNVNSTGDKLTCAAGNCPDVQSAGTKTLYEFSDSGDYGDVTGFLAADTTSKLLVVSFRGSRSFENWIANLDFPLESVDLCDGCKAHNGFWEAWQAVAEELSTNLNTAIKENSGYKVVFTGHSFGGAMATLGATALRNNGVDIDLYTLGSPRVGNKALAEYITNQGTLYRITHTNDIVPKLPPEDLGFSHPGPEYWITSDNDKTVGTGDIKVLQGLDSSDGNAGSDGTSISAHLWYFNGISDCL